MFAHTLAVAGLGAAVLAAGYLLIVGLALGAALFLFLRRGRRWRWRIGTVLLVLAAGVLYISWPCRMPTFWSMEIAGHFCREFPLRTRTYAAGTGALPGGLPGRASWVRSQLEWEALGKDFGLHPTPAVDWEQAWLLVLVDPGAAAAPTVTEIHQEWDVSGTVVVTVARPPGDPAASHGGWRILAVDRSSFWQEPSGPRALLRGGPGIYYHDPPAGQGISFTDGSLVTRQGLARSSTSPA